MAKSERQALRLQVHLLDSTLVVEPCASKKKTTVLDWPERNAPPPPRRHPELHIPAPASAVARSSPVGGAQSRQCALDCAIRRFPISRTSSAKPLRFVWPLRPQAENLNRCSGNAGKCTA